MKKNEYNQTATSEPRKMFGGEGSGNRVRFQLGKGAGNLGNYVKAKEAGATNREANLAAKHGIERSPKAKEHSDKEFAMRAKDFTIFKAGHWNGETFTEADLDNMVKSFNTGEPIPIIVGHSSDYKGQTMIPAFGRILGGLKRVGSDLIAYGAEFNESLANWIREGFYNQRSIELTRDNKRVLAVGMLGAVPPAVKGLPGNDQALNEVALQFASMSAAKSIEFAEDVLDPIQDEEEPAVDEFDPDAIDAVESMAVTDTFKTLSECCGRFLEDIEEMLESGEDPDRMVQEISELSGDLIQALGLHAGFMKKVEQIEEGNEMEYAEKSPGWREFFSKVKGVFTKRKEIDEMDKQKEKRYQEEIALLEAKVKEFQDAEVADADAVAKAEAEAKAKADEEAKAKAEAEAKAAEEAIANEVKELCEKLISENRMTPAMREVDEPIMFNLRKKDEEAFKSFSQKYVAGAVPLGEVKAINTNQTTDTRPQVMVLAEKYVKEHPKEFSDVEPAVRTQRAFYLHANGKIKFEGDK